MIILMMTTMMIMISGRPEGKSGHSPIQFALKRRNKREILGNFLAISPVPPLSRSALSPWWAPQPGPFRTSHFNRILSLAFLLTLRLLCLTVLVLGALLGSFQKRRYINVQHE